MTRTDDEIAADLAAVEPFERGDRASWRLYAANRLASDVRGLLGRVAALTEERDRWFNAYAGREQDLDRIARGRNKARAALAALTEELDDAELRVARAETALVVERARREALEVGIRGILENGRYEVGAWVGDALLDLLDDVAALAAAGVPTTEDGER